MGGGLLVDVDVDVKNTEKENLVENIAKSELVNNTSKFNENSTKQQMIKDYVTNLVNRNVSEQDVASNLSTNFSVVANAQQSNKMVFSKFNFEEASDISFSQINMTANEIAQDFEQFRQDCVDAINDAIANTEIVNEVNDAMQNGTFDKYLGEQIADAEKNVKDQITSDTGVETYTRREHGLVNFGVATNNIKEKNKNVDVTEDLVSNISSVAVVNNTDLYSRISNAYNKTVETVNKIKVEAQASIDAETKVGTNQSNEMEMTGMNFGKGTTNISFEQLNDAKANVEACAIISAIAEMSSDNSLQAISSDMMGLTQSVGNTTTTDNTTSNKGIANTTKDVGATSTTKNTKSQAATIVASIMAMILVCVVAFIVFKIYGSRRQLAVAPAPAVPTRPTALAPATAQASVQAPAMPTRPAATPATASVPKPAINSTVPTQAPAPKPTPTTTTPAPASAQAPATPIPTAISSTV